MEHTIYLAAKAFIDKVKPQTPKNKRSTKNGTASMEMMMITTTWISMTMTGYWTGTNSMIFQMTKR
jgi:hypothetical protein